jgi:hypothetical protein
VARLHVHQGATDGTSAHVANLVSTEPQLLQRVVRTVCDEKNVNFFQKILPQYLTKKSGGVAEKEFFSKSNKNNVRQGITDRSSTRVAN